MARNEAIATAAGQRFADFYQSAKVTSGEILHRNLQEETPVDTGFARDNWELEVSGDAVTVSNETEYLPNLDRGHSPQAPANFVLDTVDRSRDEAEQQLAQEALTLR